MKRCILVLCLAIVVSTALGQFNTPTIDGVVNAGEYGVHTNGQNQEVSGGQTWYMTWDNTNLYVAITNANTGEGAVLYLDKNPLAPINGGTTADGTIVGQAYDGTNFAQLQFKADLVVYFKDSYREYRTANGANGWSSETTSFGSYASSGTTRELAIPWSAIGGRPSSFAWFGYVTSSGGFVYGEMPAENAEGNIGTSARYDRYFIVNSTSNGSSTKPFSRNCYIFNSTSDVSNFGAIAVFDFTMNSGGRTITRSSDGSTWTIGGALRIDNGTINFGSSSGAATVAGDVVIGTSGTLTLSSAIGGDLKIGGNWTRSGTFNPSNREVEFNGSSSQTITGATTFHYMKVSNSSSPGVTLGDPITIASGTLTVNGTLSCGTQTISGAGNFVLNSGGTLRIGSTAGITASGATGNVQVTGSRTYSTGANYIYNGSAAQVTGNGLPSTVNNLEVGNAAGLTLTNATTVNGTLTLTDGTLTLNGNNLTIASGGSISGGSSSSYVKTDQNSAGYLVREGVSTTTVTFPVGRATYNPVTIKQITGGTDPSTPHAYSVLVRDPLVPASNDDNSALQHSWVILQSPWHPTTDAPNTEITFRWNSATEEGSVFTTNFNTNSGRTTPGLFEAWWHNPGGWTRKTGAFQDFDNTTNNSYPVAARIQTPILFGGSPWTIALSNSALPVQLASFTGTLIENNRVRLNWMTISEINNYGFYVQRRSVGVQEWTEIANSFVPGHGTTNEPQYYSFTDPTSITTATQYRLRQVDLDGTSHYSDPIQVDLPTSVPEVAPREFALKQNYPNPFNPTTEITFSVENTGHATVNVYNALGQNVATLFDDVAEAGQYYTVRFTATGLASGVYFYRLESGKRSDVKKLVLMK